MSRAINPQLQTMMDNMPKKTGRYLVEWFDLLETEQVEKQGQMMGRL